MIRKLFLLSFLAVLIIVPQAKADHMTYDFWAFQYYYLPPFTLQYVDYDDDGKFSLNELVPDSFSGLTGYTVVLADVPMYDARISPLTDGTNIIGTNTYWVFNWTDGSHFSNVGPEWWTYWQGPAGTLPPGGGGAVPLPGAVLLLGAGLGRLALYRRRRLTHKN